MTAMTLRICNAAIALGCLLAAESAWAHHSSAVFFDSTKQFTLTGTLSKVQWWNPHIQFSVEAKGDKGQAESWLIQSEPPNIMKSHNISKAIFEKAIGQTITVEVHPARDGSRNGEMGKITFQDGTMCCSQP